MIAWLEVKFLLLVHVMLHRNIETGNGALGTVLSITNDVIFLHLQRTVSTHSCICSNHSQCQGLSLDCAIVDLSDKVFSAGMAHVALSRVISLTRLHLSAFDPSLVVVSTSCLEEVNRSRESFRNDLPLYQMPPKAKPNRKHKLTGNNTISSAKKIKLSGAKSSIKTLSQQLYTKGHNYQYVTMKHL